MDHSLPYNLILQIQMETIFLFLLAYLLGSIPTSYLAARWTKGIDLCKYGSGTVSGSMLFEHTHRWLIVPVGFVDVLKGALPAWLAIQLGLGQPTSVAAGMCAVIGHNWPIYLGFTGGRGISPFLGSCWCSSHGEIYGYWDSSLLDFFSVIPPPGHWLA
jgi:glycerol-3-phosphate acyltransferase PlsY